MVAQPLDLLALLGLALPAQGPSGLPKISEVETHANGGFASLLAKIDLTESTAIVPPGKGVTGAVTVEAAFETGSTILPIDANLPKMAAIGGAEAIHENSLSMPFVDPSAQPDLDVTEAKVVVAPQPASPDFTAAKDDPAVGQTLASSDQEQPIVSAGEFPQTAVAPPAEVGGADRIATVSEVVGEDTTLQPVAAPSELALIEQPTELAFASLGQPNVTAQPPAQLPETPRPGAGRQGAAPLPLVPTDGPTVPSDAVGQAADRPALQPETLALRNAGRQPGNDEKPTEPARLMPVGDLEADTRDNAPLRPARPSLAMILGEQLRNVSAQPSAPSTSPPATTPEGLRPIEAPAPMLTVSTPPSGPVTSGPPVLAQAGQIAGEAPFTGSGRALLSEPAEQLAVQVQRQALAGRTRFNVQLEPAELGRVEVKLDFGRDGGVKAVVAVERAETFELLQRDGQSLERALRDAGFSSERMSLHYDLQNENRGQQDKQASGDPARDLNEDSNNGSRDEEDQPGLAEIASEDESNGQQLDRLIDVRV